MDAEVLGFALVFIAAIAGGTIALPLKKRRVFELENFYVPTTVLMMLVLPLLMGAVVVPQWMQALRAVGSRELWIGAAFGFCWGAGAVLYGYGVTQAGMSIGCTTIMGANTAFGSLLPFFMNPDGLRSDLSSSMILVGITGCVAGVIVCGRAGYIRECQPGELKRQRGLRVALAVCVASGALSSCANLGFTYGKRASEEAQRLGANPAFSTLASWLPVCWGAAVSMLIWFGGLQIKNGTWRKSLDPGAVHDLLMSLSMGAIWFAATIPYGMGAHFLGRLGTSVGWAVTNAVALITANALGFLTHEWTAATQEARRVLYKGLALLIGGIAILAVGNSMVAST
ncbi:MAG: L-rhamnose/proton symporter RhaT [Terracidiphilus sp.]